MDVTPLSSEAAGAKALTSLWTFPSVLFSAFLVAWGAEAAQFLVSRGMALAILAWLQTLPEFAVEAVIAWHRDVPLMTANFTGSLRLLTGLGWPMVLFVAYLFARRKGQARCTCVRLEPEQSIEIMGLLPPVLYFWVIYFKGTLTLVDSAALIAMYLFYLWTLNRLPPRDLEDVDDVPRISRWVLDRGRAGSAFGTFGLFLLGGVLLWFTTHPFLESMLALASMWGVSTFVFIQWVSPFLSEFPEKLSAFNWARQVTKAPMALSNLLSSNVNQWTVLVAMIPIVYCWSLGHVATIVFDAHQRSEILLTMAQSFLGFVLLADLEFTLYEAIGLFVLWLVQFCQPEWREEITLVYWAWALVELVRGVIDRRRVIAIRHYFLLIRGASGTRPAAT
jgi:cation:H+ antiporter